MLMCPSPFSSVSNLDSVFVNGAILDLSVGCPERVAENAEALAAPSFDTEVHRHCRRSVPSRRVDKLATGASECIADELDDIAAASYAIEPRCIDPSRQFWHGQESRSVQDGLWD